MKPLMRSVSINKNEVNSLEVCKYFLKICEDSGESFFVRPSKKSGHYFILSEPPKLLTFIMPFECFGKFSPKIKTLHKSEVNFLKNQKVCGQILKYHMPSWLQLHPFRFSQISSSCNYSFVFCYKFFSATQFLRGQLQIHTVNVTETCRFLNRRTAVVRLNRSLENVIRTLAPYMKNARSTVRQRRCVLRKRMYRFNYYCARRRYRRYVSNCFSARV